MKIITSGINFTPLFNQSHVEYLEGLIKEWRRLFDRLCHNNLEVSCPIKNKNKEKNGGKTLNQAAAHMSKNKRFTPLSL